MRLLRGELRKLVKRPATRTTFALFALLIVVIYAGLGLVAHLVPAGEVTPGSGATSSGVHVSSTGDVAALLTFPDAYHGLIALFPMFGGLALAVLAGLIVGSDWSWGTLRLAIARGEGRARYLVTGFVALAILALVGLLALFVVGVLAALVGGVLAGVPAGNLTDPAALGQLPAELVLAWLGMLVVAALAYAASAVARSQVAGIGLVIALFFGEQFATVVVPPEVLRFAPMNAASGLPVLDGSLLLPVLTALAYLVGALAVASVALERSEVA